MLSSGFKVQRLNLHYGVHVNVIVLNFWLMKILALNIQCPKVTFLCYEMFV